MAARRQWCRVCLGMLLALVPATARAEGAPAVTRPAKPPATFPITASAGPHGRITPAGLVTVAAGDSAVFVIEPEEGQHVSKLAVDGRKVAANTRYVFRSVRSKRTIEAEFEVNTYKVLTAAGPNGNISPARPPAVRHGGRLRLTLAPRAGYHLDSLLVDGVPVRRRDVLVLRGVTAPRRVAATFALNEYTITASAGVHAAISPSGVITVKHGEKQTFTFSADPGYTVRELLIDGTPVRVGASYTFNGVRDDHQITARISHPVATIIAPEPGEVWTAGEVQSIHWQPFDDALSDSGEVRVSFHGWDGPWLPVWRGPLSRGAAEWKVVPIETDSLVVSIVSLLAKPVPGMDFTPGLVRVRASQASTGASKFFVRPVPNPASSGPVRIDFALPMAGEAMLEIYSVSGQQVWHRPLGYGAAGERQVVWDGLGAQGDRAVPGIYFVRLVSPHGTRHCRLVVLP